MAGRIPREFIQQLLNRIDIVDLIDSRIPLKKKSGSNFFTCCPFHTEKSPSFSVSQSKQFYHCFGCGAHGNAIDFMMQYDRLAFPEAIDMLAKQLGIEIPRESITAEKNISHDDLYDLLDAVAKFYQQQLRQNPRATDYLKNRGLSGQIAKQFGLGFIPPGWNHLFQQFGQSTQMKQQLLDTGMIIKKEDGGYYDRFRDRIMFPIHNRRGRIIGFGGRILDKGDPKYLNSPETIIFQKGHELYGLYQALQTHRELERALIVEGYMDVIALFQHGITYAMATLGTATTANHLQRLFRYTSDIIFCFDGDQAGRTAAWRALQATLPIMKDGIQIRFMFLPDGEDPDTLVRKEGTSLFEQRIQHSLTIADFFFQTLAEHADLTSSDGKARFIKSSLEHLQKLPDSIFRQIMHEELAKRTRTDVEKLNSITKNSLMPKNLTRPSVLKVRPPSALRLIMALLVQHPELIDFLPESLPRLELNGFDLFLQVIESIKQHPGFNTGTLLEHWRDQPEQFKWLSKLAQFDHMIPETGIQSEFLGGIQRLQSFGQKQQIEQMLSKASQNGLSTEEKQKLNEMIQAHYHISK